MTTAKELWKKRKALKSYWSAESFLTQEIVLTLLERLEDLIEISKKRKHTKRKTSEWSLFLGSQLKEGKTIQEAASNWKHKKSPSKDAVK